MIARVKRWLHDEGVRTTPGRDGVLWVECELTDPPSSKGRSVDLLLDAQDVTALLLALRDSARDARRGPTTT